MIDNKQKFHDVCKMVADLMDQFHLVADGWRFKFDHSKRRYGSCRYSRKMITLSYDLVMLNDISETKNTILHEIAHALAGPKAGHGPLWKSFALSIGCSGDRCYDSTVVKQPEGTYTGVCPNCQKTSQRYRFSKRMLRLACSKCCQRFNFGKYDPRFIIKWTRSDGILMN